MVAFHILDPAEIDFPFSQAANFQDLETREILPVTPDKYAAEYQRHVRAHIEALGNLCGRHGVDYVLLNSSKPLDEALYAYLVFRQKKVRSPR